MKGKQKLNCSDIEIAVANYFNPRIHLIVPNIHWGMQLHECDLLVMNGQNYGVEVEIKISKADLKKDIHKKHGHHSDRIRRLFFAIPEYMYTEENIALIPDRAGIITVTLPEIYDYPAYYNEQFITRQGVKKSYCVMQRSAKINKLAIPFTDKERVQMGRLGMLRYWSIRNDHKEKSILNDKERV